MTTYSQEGKWRNRFVIREADNGFSLAEVEKASGYTTPVAGDLVFLDGSGKIVHTYTSGEVPYGVLVPHKGDQLADPVSGFYQVVWRHAQVSNINFGSYDKDTAIAQLNGAGNTDGTAAQQVQYIEETAYGTI
jgi:hypothetical protein